MRRSIGGSATFTASATGTVPLSYQRRRNDVNTLAAATIERGEADIVIAGGSDSVGVR